MIKKVLKKPTIVLMAGLPGVGKSTLARNLGEQLDYPVLERDAFKDPLLDNPEIHKDFSEDVASRAAYELFFNLAHELIVNQHRSVVLDSSTLYPFILERSKELAAQAEAELKIILCSVDEPTRQKRLRTRPKRKSQAYSHLMTEEKAHELEKLPSDTLRIETEEGKMEENIKDAIAYVKNKKSSFYNKLQEMWRTNYEMTNNPLSKDSLAIAQMGSFMTWPGTYI